MDIHKPKPWHGWREFGKELVTIVLGVLIALAAEQAVEALHWAERTEKTEAHLRVELANATVAAQAHITQEACEYAMLDRLQQALLQPGDDWKPPYVIAASPNGAPGAVFAAPIGGFESQGWKNAQADGAANHLGEDDELKFERAYDLLAAAAGANDAMHGIGSEMNSLAFARRLDPQSRTEYLRLITKLREDVRYMATNGRLILQQTAELGVTPGKLEDYGPSLKIYQGICDQFRASKAVITIVPPKMGA
jgi:type II secretory pathway pseudopilin PulG